MRRRYRRGYTDSHIPVNPILVSLLSKRIAHYHCDEAADSLLDSVTGTLSMPAYNSPLNEAGVVDGARTFVRASSQYFSIGNTAALSFSSSFWFSAWLKFTDLPTQSTIFSSQVAATSGYIIVKSTTYLVFRIHYAGGTYIVTSNVALTNGLWYHLLAWYDDVTDTIKISVNGSTPVSTAAPNGLAASTMAHGIGRAGATGFDGSMDEIIIGTGVLTDDEKSLLYNNPEAVANG